MTVSRNDLERFYRPPPPDERTKAEKKRAEFEALNKLVTSANAWITSVPGDPIILIDALPSSNLPDELRELGYRVVQAGSGERIVAHTIVERFTRRANGELELMTPGSTAPVAEVRSHAGIVPILRFEAIKR